MNQEQTNQPSPDQTDYTKLRESVIEYMLTLSVPRKLSEIAKSLGIRSDTAQHALLHRVIDDLIEADVIRKTTRRRLIPSILAASTSFTGELIMDYPTSGYIETGRKDFPVIHIKQQQTATAMHGDTVEVKLLALRKNKKPRGEVVKIIKRNDAPIAGVIEYDGDFFYFRPDEENYSFDFLVPVKKLNGAKPGDKVMAMFLRWENPHGNPEAQITEVVGRAGDVRAEYDALVKEFRLPPAFPLVVEQEASNAATAKRDLSRRTDMRNELVITIDPDDAKDFDDALSLRHMPNGNLELGVHIADVSTYVQDGTTLDSDALKRANSYYLVDRVVPMLPEILSNSVCSLVPNQDRLAYSVFIEFDATARAVQWRIAETVINSKRRFTYGEVQEILEGNHGEEPAANITLVLELNALALRLRERRYATGGIDFDTSEIRYILDENKNPLKAIRKTRTDATGLVEECMLAANQTVTEHVAKLSAEWRIKKGLPFMFRIHDEPDTEKLRNAFTIIRSFGIDAPHGSVSSRSINILLDSVRSTPQASMINQVLLRSQAKAVYAAYNIGHFGLGFANYTHFTSPIRRYPDVVVHRLLKEYAQGKPTAQRIEQLRAELDEIADYTSQQERMAIEAERASQKLAQVLMARQRIGAEYAGTVSGVTNFGIFVILDEIYVEGLIPLRDMEGDYFQFEERTMRLIGRRSKQVFSIGTRLRAQIINVKVDKRLIDLRLKTGA
ncbi:MAG: ribonuclease R [Candidatus Kapabacteria bacterium]|nr:ribonuclease R [Candidatus Kapabacteria bacterium]